MACAALDKADSFPALTALGLRAEHRAVLTRQGALCAEHAGGRRRYKLRFRLGTKQVVRYVGVRSPFVRQVRRELARLQGPWRLQQRLRRLSRRARDVLRGTKRTLEPLLASEGYAFHGRDVRRSCTAVPNSSATAILALNILKRRFSMSEPSNPPPAPHTSNLAKRSRRRIRQFQQESLDDSNPLLGLLGYFSGDLMEIGELLGRPVKRSIKAHDSDCGLKDLLSGVNTLRDVHRQVGRYVDLRTRLGRRQNDEARRQKDLSAAFDAKNSSSDTAFRLTGGG